MSASVLIRTHPYKPPPRVVNPPADHKASTGLIFCSRTRERAARLKERGYPSGGGGKNEQKYHIAGFVKKKRVISAQTFAKEKKHGYN